MKKLYVYSLVSYLVLLLTPNMSAQNTLLGTQAGQMLTSGQQNTFLGYRAGQKTTTAPANTFIGHDAGANNTTGDFDTFIGVQAGISNTTGTGNFILGVNAGTSNTTGPANVFIGNNAGGNNVNGGFNLYLGANAGNGTGVNGNNNVAIGFESGRGNNSGSTNTFIGFRADANVNGLSNATTIGANAVASVSNTVMLGNGASVGIGTSNPGSFRLAVEGKIGAREIEVRVPPSSWADFVFKPGYQLRSLQQVERFIQREGHLPDVPSGQDVEKNGVALGEMNARLLQKIEELTLYVIALEKRTQRQGRQLTRLAQQLSPACKTARQ